MDKTESCPSDMFCNIHDTESALVLNNVCVCMMQSNNLPSMFEYNTVNYGCLNWNIFFFEGALLNY